MTAKREKADEPWYLKAPEPQRIHIMDVECRRCDKEHTVAALTFHCTLPAHHEGEHLTERMTVRIGWKD